MKNISPLVRIFDKAFIEKGWESLLYDIIVGEFEVSVEYKKHHDSKIYNFYKLVETRVLKHVGLQPDYFEQVVEPVLKEEYVRLDKISIEKFKVCHEGKIVDQIGYS